MKHALAMFVLAVATRGSLPLQAITGDATRGEQVLRDRGCIVCHKVNGQGGHFAPDLGRRIARNYTPGFLAGLIWNHAASLRFSNTTLATGSLSEQQAADLFAYFSSRRFFELPGNAARGKQLFVAKHCAGCHGISTSPSPDANPVVAWSALRDPVALAQAMWNRPQLMDRALARRRIRHPRLTPAELTDLLNYLENLPPARGKQPRFYLASPEEGRVLFQATGCGGCHQGKLSLGKPGSRLTPVGVAAALWNHELGSEGTRRVLSYEEMTGILGYLWSIDACGNQRHGEQLFARKKCSHCHAGPEAGARGPGLSIFSQREPAPVSMVAALWKCGSSMRAEMAKRSLAWPRFTASEMTDLLAHLQTRHSPVPATRMRRAPGIENSSRLHDHR